MACHAGKPTVTSRRGWRLAHTMACAASSGWKTGGTGRGLQGKVVRAQSNCGVLKADSWTMVSATALRSWISSERSESVKARNAAFAPQ
ncbi:hypothetical protein EV676_101576 [Caldimonas thermodepolymerans]|uniref:Uncharacterized protein n=1 Tax=Caldimonas thermodepolymerans TaxID=215580 RepID=A0AA46DHI9_9BURK|nr:hypothetical protein EV676_101576 [Caldimonas thermodepolymerans]